MSTEKATLAETEGLKPSSSVVDTFAMDAPSPKVADSLAALTLSSSSEGKTKSCTLPVMGERLTEWLENELLGESNVSKSPKSGEEDGSSASEGRPRQSKTENKLYIKLLVSNAASGSVIGKMGVNIHHTQTTTGAKIQLSKPLSVFPGTNERTLLIRGNLCQLAAAVYAIFIRLIEEECAPIWRWSAEDDEEGRVAEARQRQEHRPESSSASESDGGKDDDAEAEMKEEKNILGSSSEQNVDDGKSADEQAATPTRGASPTREASPQQGRFASYKAKDMDLTDAVANAPLQVKLLIPEEFIGIIVGRRGETVINICDTTNTTIKVFPQPNGVNCLTHQVVSIRGHLIDIIKAISMIVLKQADDPEFYGYANIPYTYYTRQSYEAAAVMPMYAPYGMSGADPTGASHGGHAMGAGLGIHMHPVQFVQSAGGTSSSAVRPSHSPPGGPMVSIMVPLLPGQQSMMLENMGSISQNVQSITGVLLKLESVPGHNGFCIRLDGPRENVMMAMNIIHAQIAYPTPGNPGMGVSPLGSSSFSHNMQRWAP